MTEQTQHPHADDEIACAIQEDSEIEEAVGALKNDRCRRIIRETDQEPLSADELSDRCEIPLSTVYRVVQQLVDIGILEKRVRLSSYPQYTHEYALVPQTITIDIGGESVLSLSVSRDSEAAGRAEHPNQQLSAD